MAYIGKTPVIGNFQKCDAITVVNGQAAYTMQVGGVNVNPESENHMLVSLNGVLQAPVDSFTVSGSTITFASNLSTGDVIDFIMLLGNVLDLGTPSDNTVTASKLNNDIISGQTALGATPADTDELLISDAGTLKRVDYSYLKSTNTPAFHASLSASTDISDASDTKLQCNTELYDTDNCYDNSTNYRFTPTTAGKYLIYGSMTSTEVADTDMRNVALMVHKNGSRVDYFGINFRNSFTRTVEISGSTVVDMNGSSDYVELFVFADTQSNSPTILGGTNQKCFFGGYKLIT